MSRGTRLGPEYPIYGIQCAKCVHLSFDPPADGIGSQCTAFKRIPAEILKGGHDHRQPYPGDGGVKFEQRTDIPG